MSDKLARGISASDFVGRLRTMSPYVPHITRRQALTSTFACGSAIALGCHTPAAPSSTAPAVAKKLPATLPTVPEPRQANGRFIRTQGAQLARLRGTKRALAYQPGQSRAAFEHWRTRVRDKLRELLRLPDRMTDAPPRMISSQSREGYVLQRWESYPEPWSVVPFYMLVPDGVSAQSPASAVMCFAGTGFTKEGLAGEPELKGVWRANDPRAADNQMALEYAKAGMVAVAMDHPGMGELSEPGRESLSESLEAVGVQALWEGRSYESLCVLQKLCVLDWLKQQPFIRTNQIATSGHSFGSTWALDLAVLDESIAAVVFNDTGKNVLRRAMSVSLLPLKSYTYLPGLQEWFDYSDLYAAVAPRPMLFSEGMRPPLEKRLRTAWQLYGAADRMKVVQHPKFIGRPDPTDNETEDPPTFASLLEWRDYGYADAADHFFHADTAVPWVKKWLGEEI